MRTLLLSALLSPPPLVRGLSSASVARRIANVRPSLDDVQRLSRGDSTKRRGVGSRRVPHRLNADERDIFETAIRNGYAIVDGTAHRRHKEAKGSPLLNILRQRADALARPLVWVEKHRQGEAWFACIDYSPVRLVEADAIRELHARTLRVAEEEAIAYASLESPWTEARGAEEDAAAALLDDAILEQPIWALAPSVARFAFMRESEEQRKECKRCVRVLAREFAT